MPRASNESLNPQVIGVGNDSHSHTGATLSGIDISADTNLVAGTNITLVDDTLNVDDAFVKNDQADTISDTLTIGDVTNNLILNPASGPDFNGTGRPTRYIELDVIRFVPEGDAGANAGTLTRHWDTTNFRAYYRWTSGIATQDMDYYAEFLIPADFSAWAAANSFNIDVRTNDKDANTLAVTMYINADTPDAGISAVNILPSANDTWETKQDQPTGTYSAGQRAKLKIRVANDAISDTIDIARIWLSYLASY